MRFWSRRTAGRTTPRDPPRLPVLAGLLSAACALACALRAAEAVPAKPGAAEVPTASPLLFSVDQPVRPKPGDSPARKTALVYCQMCHLFPEPDLLDRRCWSDKVFPRMRAFMGLTQLDFDRYSDGDLMKASGAYPKLPIISEKDWEVIANYYLETAPFEALPQEPHAEIEVGLKHFQSELPEFRLANPSTTLTYISPSTQRIYAGQDDEKSLCVLNSRGQLLNRLNIGNSPVCLIERDRGLLVTSIGSFQPSEVRRGEIIWIEGLDRGQPTTTTLLRELPRTTYTEFADLNGDGRPDMVACLYGDLTGRFSWYEALPDGQYKEHVLLRRPGAVRSAVHDFNRDGFPDIAVLVTQNFEWMIIYLNDGKGNFTPHTVFQWPPVYGHNFFELADFNRDGNLDFLVTNGDNAEYDYSPTKRYHGIRIYLNRGGLRFERAFFYPMNGAIKAVARDYDEDGDLDLAAISFFPDYVKSPRESFVYLANQGDLTFKATTFRECIAGRWITMDVGDLDGDGDLDLVLGSYIHGPLSVPRFLMEAWEKNRLPVVILRNTLRGPSTSGAASRPTQTASSPDAPAREQAD